jgi:hypothetical protein
VSDGADESQVGIGGVNLPEYLRPVYANYVNATFTPWDFRLTFAVLKSPLPGPELDAAREAGSVTPEAVADIIIPANLMAALLTLLQNNFNNYVSRYGVPGMEPGGPQGMAPPGPSDLS